MKKTKVLHKKTKDLVELSKDREEKSATKQKTKREPLPMKMRAFPQSFWQEPNNSGIFLPTSFCSPIQEVDSISNGHIVGKPNTDLLFSLFENVNHGSEKEKHLPLIKRGRPRKQKPSYELVNRTKDEDPYFTSAIVPVVHSKEEEKTAQEQKIMALISVTGGTENIQFNSSYSKRLSDLVINL